MKLIRRINHKYAGILHYRLEFVGDDVVLTVSWGEDGNGKRPPSKDMETYRVYSNHSDFYSARPIAEVEPELFQHFKNELTNQITHWEKAVVDFRYKADRYLAALNLPVYRTEKLAKFLDDMKPTPVDYTNMTQRVCIYGLTPTDTAGIYQNHKGTFQVDLSATALEHADKVIIQALMLAV